MIGNTVSPYIVALGGLRARGPGMGMLGMAPMFPAKTPLLATKLIISGVTKDNTGTPLANCTVSLYRTLDSVLFETVISDASGHYEFSAIGPAETYFIVAYKAGSPDVTGTTVNVLLGV